MCDDVRQEFRTATLGANSSGIASGVLCHFCVVSVSHAWNYPQRVIFCAILLKSKKKCTLFCREGIAGKIRASSAYLRF